jgi:Xaa-Pro aminopeptidase
MDYKSRQSKLRSALQRGRVDALLVTHLPNIRYLCGFTGSAGILLITESKSVFFTDGRYKEQAATEVQGAQVVIGKKSALAQSAEWLRAKAKQLGVKVLGLEAEHSTIAEKGQLRTALGSSLRFKDTYGLVERARMIKDEEEIACLREAVQLGSSLFEVVLKAIRPGRKEVEVAAELEYAARRAGAEGMSFETIVASGPRSALPHGRASEAEIPKNGFVVCDFGIILAGYCSDMTRTVHVGAPSSDARHMYESVRDSQEAAVERVGSGVSAGEVDRAARQLLTNKGLGKYFSHSTGHGVGLEIHEPPRVARAQSEALEAGMVITIEPGVYIPQTGGVRIEDMVLVTEDGCQVLTPTRKELVVI